MKKIFNVIAILFLIASSAAAQTAPLKYQWQEMKGDGDSYRTVKGDPMGMRFYTLPNGLTVILSVNKELPRVQTLIATKAGSKNDPSDHTGLAHYLEHMLFKGTDKYGSLDWAKESKLLEVIDELYETYNHTTDETKRTAIYHQIDSVSGESAKFAIANEYDKMMTLIGAKGTNAFTSFEQTVYVNDIPSNQIDKWIAVEAERLRNPVFRIFHTELEAVYEEKNRGLDNDGEKVSDAIFESLFKKHTYGTQTTIGTIDHLKNPSLKEIRKYFYKNYVPNNMAIIMIGDMDPNVVIGKIKKSFAYMQPKPVAPYTFEKEDEIKAPIIKEVKGPDAESVSMAYRFPGAASKDATMLNFMSSVLSNGTAGLLDLNLVKKQLVLEASAGAYVLQDYSVLFFDGKAKEGQKLEEVKDALLGQIKLLKEGKFDDNLLKAIINNYKKSLIQRRESNAGRAYTILDNFCTNTDWANNCAELDMMSKLTKKDIQAFCNKYLNENYVCVYKRIGEDANVQKVNKPTITPVEVNRNAQSEFVGNVNKIPSTDMKPVFVDYAKDIARGSFKGVDVLSVQNKTNNLYSLYYYLNIGEWHDKLLPIAIDYLQYLGTKKNDADAISKLFYQTASDFGVNASKEESYVFLNGLQENFTKDVSLFEDLLNNCQPDKEALNEMIAGIKKKRSDNKRNKMMIRQGLSSYARYGGNNPFNYGLSNAELDAITPDQLVAILHSLTKFKHKIMYYGPLANAAVVKTIAPLHNVPATFTPTPALHEFKFSKQDKSNVFFTDFDMVQSELSWIRNGDNYNEDKIPVINLFNEYFGGSMSGVVFQDIRESKALAYSTYAGFNVPIKKEDPFSINAYVGCQADKMKESIAAMNALLTNLPESEKMFDQAKQSLMTNISTTRITKTGILFNYLSAQKRGQTMDIRKKVYDNIDGYKFSEINNFFTSNIANKAYSLCVFGSDKKMNWDELNKFGPVTKLSLADIFGY
jgi:predicted Zn-dependent peptidase